jgi:hypothetical protein
MTGNFKTQVKKLLENPPLLGSNFGQQKSEIFRVKLLVFPSLLESNFGQQNRGIFVIEMLEYPSLLGSFFASKIGGFCG